MYTVDNDRPDIQKAYWRDQGQKIDNYHDKMRIDAPIASYAQDAEGATKLSDVVTKLVHQGGGDALYDKQHLFLDIDWNEIEEYIALQVITPNGDGNNDTWIIYNIENHPGTIIRVFNRWGKEVFYSRNYKNDWNGNGLNEGTYYYLLKIKEKDGSERSSIAWITLIRD